ncbi:MULTISPECIES: DUF1853 family protein [unclassified Neptuniibacter]|uniref:DUF1853 family protein n=1 Tax=unclassified Neptuniibacter TaxID=2630693 RepID=UPI0025DC79E5|nr:MULTISPECIES: DUF1853 family protein [unclassified Neptuniibacter]|tara:strand:+ start:1930 stop:2757 length:828 start_codon:yes stop_codon:yes gene_type:complete
MNDDLFWILNAQPLMNDKSPCTDSATEWLNKLYEEIDPDILQNTYKPLRLNPRLGIYYEDMVNTIINSSPYLHNLKRNIQVNTNGVTLGEFDFLGTANGHNGEYDFHLECAVKFYICTGEGTKLSDFVGPNKRDRLDIKYQKMLTKQLTLSQEPAGQSLCAELGLCPTRFMMLLQGYLFYHFKKERPVIGMHADINPNHNQGWWLYENEMMALGGQYAYQVLSKPSWLAIKKGKIFSLSELQLHITSMSHPALIARLNGETLHEIDRGFVMPIGW